MTEEVLKLPNELRTYFAQACVDKTVSPLDYWKSHAEFFPLLTKMAVDYLAIQATSATSERVFSKSKHVISDLRSRLGDRYRI